MRSMVSRLALGHVEYLLALGLGMSTGCASSNAGSEVDAGDRADVAVARSVDGGTDAVVGPADSQTGSETATPTDSPTGVPIDAMTAHDAGVDAGPFIAIPLLGDEGVAYSAQVTVGTQTFSMDLDTGSTTVGVASMGCTTCSSVGVSPLYVPGTTATNMNHTAQAQYEDGSGWSGEIYQDTVGLAHGTPNVLLSFVAISSQDQFFQDDSSQGILGLGPIQNAEPYTNSYVARAVAAGVGDLLAFEMCTTTGTMWLGGYDPAAAASPVQYTPMVPISINNAFYSINVDSMALGTTNLGSVASSFQEPVIDTGTSLFYLPTPIFTALVNAINASTAWTSLGAGQLTDANEDCVSAPNITDAMLNALPPITFTLPSSTAGAPGFTLSLSASQYFFGDGQGGLCLAPGDGGDQDGATFGDAFMSAFVTVIDIKGQRIGFAPDAGCGVTQKQHHVFNRAAVLPRVPHRHHR